MRSGNDDLRGPWRSSTPTMYAFIGRAVVVAVTRDLLGLRQQRLHPAQVEPGCNRASVCWMIPVTMSPFAAAFSSCFISRSASRMRCRITCLAVYRGDAAEVGGSVVPPRVTLPSSSSSSAIARISPVSTSISTSASPPSGIRLYAVDERVGQSLEHDLLGDPLLDHERRQRFEHLRVLHALAPFLAPLAFAHTRACSSHTRCAPFENGRAWVMSSLCDLVPAVGALDHAVEVVGVNEHAIHTLRAAWCRNFTDTVWSRATPRSGPVCAATGAAGAAHLEGVRARQQQLRVENR